VAAGGGTGNQAASSFRVPEPEPVPPPKSIDPCDEVIFDDELIAKIMENMAKHGMTAEDIFG
jgi:hypothetical protein